MALYRIIDADTIQNTLTLEIIRRNPDNKIQFGKDYERWVSAGNVPDYPPPEEQPEEANNVHLTSKVKEIILAIRVIHPNFPVTINFNG